MCCFYEAKTVRLNKASLRKEPSEPIDVDLVRAQHAGEMCPICSGIGSLLCAQCEDGCVPFLGDLQERCRCRGAGLIAYFICEKRRRDSEKVIDFV